MPAVEHVARGGVLRAVGGAVGFVPAQCRLDLGRQVCTQPVGLGDEVRERRGGVGEDHRAQSTRLGQRVFLREEPTPRLTEYGVPVADAEMLDEQRQLADEQFDRPELRAQVRPVRAAAVADLVVEHDRATAVGEPGQRREVVVRRTRPAVQDDDGQPRRREIADDAVPGRHLLSCVLPLHHRKTTPLCASPTGIISS
jgi:hypothetical protein